MDLGEENGWKWEEWGRAGWGRHSRLKEPGEKKQGGRKNAGSVLEILSSQSVTIDSWDTGSGLKGRKVMIKKIKRPDEFDSCVNPIAV